MTTQIKCPHCGEEFEVSKALAHSIRDELEKEIASKYQRDAENQIKHTVNEATAKLQAELDFKTKKLDDARNEQLKLHQEKLQLEDEKRLFEIEKNRQLNEEREKIRQQTLTEFSDTHRLKDAEKDKIIGDLKKSLEEAQRKVSQSSQQLQGEVLELDLENFLRSHFLTDDISSVEKGVKGADVTQVVKTTKGTTCGKIIWEIKRTKAWVDDWVSKLKEDQRVAKADLAVIVTTTLPKNLETGFGAQHGVWITLPKYVEPLTEILRKSLIDIARERHLSQDRGTKADLIYTYLTSNDFILQIQNILEVYEQQQSQIQKEKAAFEKLWREREVQSQRIIHSLANIYGTIQGAAGSSLPPVKGLDLLDG